MHAFRLTVLFALWLGRTASAAEEPVPTVVVVGGGYAGLAAAKKLGESHKVNVVLVDREPAHTSITELPEFVASGKQISFAFADLAKLHNFQFIRGDVSGWDAAKKTLSLKDGSTLPYQSLVLAVGGKSA